MGARGCARKHGVGFLLKRTWRRMIIQTKYVSEKMITTTIKCDQRKIELTSLYFPPTRGTRTCTSRRCTKTSRPTATTKKHIAGDFIAQLGPGTDSERDHVGETRIGTIRQTRDLDEAVVYDPELCGFKYDNQKNKTSETIQYTFRSPSRKEKQLDYVVIDKRNEKKLQ